MEKKYLEMIGQGDLDNSEACFSLATLFISIDCKLLIISLPRSFICISLFHLAIQCHSHMVLLFDFCLYDVFLLLCAN